MRGAADAMAAAYSGLTTARAALVAQHAELARQVAEIDRMIANMGGGRGTSTAFPSAGRPTATTTTARGGDDSGYRSGSLKEKIHQILSGAGGAMSVKDITEGVRASGYKTKNKTLAKSVGIALTDMRGVRKIGRGMYRM